MKVYVAVPGYGLMSHSAAGPFCTEGPERESFDTQPAAIERTIFRLFEVEGRLLYDISGRKVKVMRVYKKDKLDYPVMGIAALPDEKLMKSSQTWLKGCYGLAGEPPRYSQDNQAVEYDTIDGKSHSVPLKK